MSEKLTLHLGDEGRSGDPPVQALCPLCRAAARPDRLRPADAGGRGGLVSAAVAVRRRVRSRRARGCPTCSTFAADAAGGDGRGRRLRRRGAAVGALRHRAAAGRGLSSASFCCRSSSSSVPPVTFWRSSLLYATWLALVGLAVARAAASASCSAASASSAASSCSAPGRAAARIEALADSRGAAASPWSASSA